MNIFTKMSVLAVMTGVLGAVAPVSASNADANVPGLSTVAIQVATWMAGAIEGRLIEAVKITRPAFTLRSPLVTIDGNHMTIEAKRLPDSAPLRGFSGPRKKQS
jgi:hypothetical protein